MRSAKNPRPPLPSGTEYSSEYYEEFPEETKPEPSLAFDITVTLLSAGAGATLGWYIGIILTPFTFGISLIAAPILGAIIGAFIGFWAASQAAEPAPTSKVQPMPELEKALPKNKVDGSTKSKALAPLLIPSKKQKEDSPQTLVRIDIYITKSETGGWAPFSQYDDHAAAEVTLLSEKPKAYFANYGYRSSDTYYDNIARLRDYIREGKYEEKISLYAYESQGANGFEGYKNKSQKEYPVTNVSQYSSLTRSCVHAAELPIKYFGVHKHQSATQKYGDFFKKILLGCFGTVCCGCRSCPTFPGVKTPADLYKYAGTLYQSTEQQKLRALAENYYAESRSDDTPEPDSPTSPASPGPQQQGMT